MPTSTTSQFVLLLWKNWLLQKRRVVLTIFQIILPAIFGLILLLIRTVVDSNFVDNPKIYSAFEANTTLPPSLIIPPRIQLSTKLSQWQLAYSPDVPIVRSLVNSTAYLTDGSTPAVIGQGNFRMSSSV